MWTIVIAVVVGFFIKEAVDAVKREKAQREYLNDMARNWQRNAWQPGDPLHFD